MKRTDSHKLTIALVAGLLVCSNVSAQSEPIRNWAAPLYWLPSDRESALMKQAAEMPGAVQELSAAVNADATVSAQPLVFVAITPCRMLDTRSHDSTFTGVYGPPSLAAGKTRTIPVAGVKAGYCSIPSAAQAVSINVTLWPGGGSVHSITIWPAGQPRPGAPTLSDYQDDAVNSAAVAPLGTGGAFNAYVTDTMNLFIDVNGYYLAPSALALGAGAVGSPALTFSDATTGLYSASPGSLSIATSGAERVQVNSTGLSVTGNLDFTNAITQNRKTLLRSSSDSIYLGLGALGNLTATYNSAFGANALGSITSGNWNTGVGWGAGNMITSGGGNVAVGESALYNVAGGNENTAVGAWSLQNATGFGNIALGASAGQYLFTGNYNIYLGNPGATGESSTIRIGNSNGNQNRAFVSGIRGITTGSPDAVAVVIDSNGQLGTMNSSRTVKRDIQDMGDTTGTIMDLRPVRFRYKVHGPDSPEHYGLVAEEVAEVAPDLVARNKGGEIETVFYDKVYAMMLNQVQTQQRLIESQKLQLQSQSEQLVRLESRLAELESRLK